MRASTFLHAGWQFIETRTEGAKIGYSNAEWLPAEVPGHVHLDLMANGIIPDPHQAMHEMGVQWVDETDWSYRTEFEWSPKPELPRRVLRFNGLDTVCTVLLNGEAIANHDNMFVPLEIDVTDRLREGKNELRIDFRSAAQVGRERRSQYFATEGLPEDQPWFFERAFVRKVQCMFGWDWGPRLVSCGIWQPVELIEYAARITDVYVTFRPLPDGAAELTIRTEIEGEGEVRHMLDEETLLPDGTHILSDVDLWSPEDPVTYTLSTFLERDGELSDLADREIGCSETKLVREPDQWGESFEFVHNGRRIWARGANWIPDFSFPSAITRERLRDRLTKAKEMGFNMLRVWGGGLYETDEFYELCTELGILVWQDFPFGCSYYPDDDLWQAVLAKEAEVNIRRLRSYPCLALWCGNNENSEMHENAWMGVDRRPSRFHGERLYDGTLAGAVAKHDPGRSYIPTSPIGQPPADAPIENDKRRGPNSDHYGDQHNWDVWHGRGDWRYYTDSKGRFSSEYGFAASCSLSTWEYVESADVAHRDYRDSVFRWHDKTGKGYETYVGYTELHYPKSRTLEEWVYYSQLNQRDALRCGVEHYRRSEFCRGSLIWQLNDIWPVQSWAILDSEGNRKALGYELERLYDDILISLVRKNEIVEVWVCNHGEDDLEFSETVQARHLATGELLRSADVSAVVHTDGIALAGAINVAGLSVPDTLIACDDAWLLLAEPKEARFAPATPITISTAYEGFIDVQVDAPVVDLMLTDEGSPAAFRDNFVTFPEPGSRLIRIEGDFDTVQARSLSGVHPVRITRSPI